MTSDARYKILAVDDEAQNLAELNRILCAEYTILTASSGRTALQRIAEERPDIILLDAAMPDMDGFEALANLKNDSDIRNIPVIIMIEPEGGEDDEEKGLFLGAVDCLAKPFKSSMVKARIRTHMQIVHHLRMVERLGMIDPLTGIANRRSFNDRVAMEWRRAARDKKPLSLMMIDVDNFKLYNGAHGHPQGDVLLKAIARILAAAAKRPGDLAARLGGEEFCLMLPQTNPDAALAIAEGVRALVEAARIPTAAGTRMTSATISIGVLTAIPQKDETARDFIAKADANLYMAKNTGRNKVVST
ncbi:MAG: diguanylate cyclase [Planctomycetota bacterium]|nr:diguanylate cyclase [Planctomycetota bacterium]